MLIDGSMIVAEYFGLAVVRFGEEDLRASDEPAVADLDDRASSSLRIFNFHCSLKKYSQFSMEI